MVGELVLVRNRLTNLQAGAQDERLVKAIADLSMVTSDLQNAVMKTRMQPIKKVYGKFPRVVRDLARSLNKEISLELRGEDTEVDKNLVEMLNDPLVHLVRNSCDHGIETPEARVAAGKPRAGTVLLAAEQAGDHILLTIADDGAGMDPDVLRRKVVEKKLMDAEAAARLTDSECYNLIFLPGFSTKTEISDVSGRGVGMDVVRTKIGSLNGSIEIESERGKGTRMLIRVPLTLAIMPALMVVVEKRIFALPLASVAEILDMDLTSTNTVDGQTVALVREKALPLFYLQHWLIPNARGSSMPEAGHVVIAHVGTQRVGLVVDQLIGQEEVVIKPLGSRLQGTPGLAGATITGDGRIALILDLPMLVRHNARRQYQEVA
jgi:two-component system chemotaxis sensor kinase CheA